MTREFNKRQRNDSRPSFRNQSSSDRYEEKPAPRSARPRLNRETVDRAWEKGAPRLYPDYRPRGDNRQASSRNWRNNNQRSDSFSSHDSGGQRQYSRDHYRGNAQNGERGNQRPYPRSSDSDRQRFDEQRPRPYNNYRRNKDDAYQQNGRPPYRNNDQPRDRIARYPDQERDGRRNDHHRPFERDNRGYNRTSDPSGRAPAGRREGPRNDQRPYRSEQHPGTYEARQAPRRYPAYNERFEGDYEGLSNDDRHSPSERFTKERGRNNRPDYRREQPEQRQERHVTPLPDGRVLKGSRPAQRKNAQFWTEVSDETEELVNHVHPIQPLRPPVRKEEREKRTTEPLQSQEGERTALRPPASSLSARKPGRRVASAVRRNPGKPRSATQNAQPAQNGPVPRPSQRGFKWPAQ